MLTTHADAIHAFQAVGIFASRRDCALGDTIVVPLGRPSTHKGVVVHPSVLWLVPSASGWRLEQPVSQIPRKEAFSNLDAACSRAIAIAQSFSLIERCSSCGRPADLDFGERHGGGASVFWVSTACRNCGARVESDGEGALPDNLRRTELLRQGEWAVVVKPPLDSAQWQALRRALQLSLPELAELKARLPCQALLGTFAEATRFYGALTKANIVAELEHTG